MNVSSLPMPPFRIMLREEAEEFLDFCVKLLGRSGRISLPLTNMIDEVQEAMVYSEMMFGTMIPP